jgi:predicted Zn-dependent protease
VKHALLAIAIGLLSTSVGATAPASRDKAATQAKTLPPEIDAIRAELQRGVNKLRLPDAATPYRAEARMVRADLVSLDGSYGGIITNVMERQAIGTVDMRVGSPARDNGNFFGSESGIARFEVPIEPAPAFVRKKVWLGLDQAFRGATQSFAQKQVVLERLAGDEPPPDFTPAAGPVTRLAALSKEPIDREGLGALVSSLSARFEAHPAIDNGDVHFQVLRSQETVVATDGVIVQYAHDRAVLAVVADTKADDGMHLDHGLALHFDAIPVADDGLLERGEALVDQVLTELEQMAEAPLMEEEYDGPILFETAAAAQFLASTVATEAAGTPAPMGDSGRLMELEPAWHKRLGKTVMPPFIDLIDDPSADGFGSFQIDAQGVRPGRLAIVERGRLATLLMTRTPNVKIGESNGRARMTPALESGPTISNLSLESSRRGLSTSALERELLRRAREDGYEVAYVIESLRDGSVLGPVPRESAAAYAGTGKLNLPLPAKVYRLEPGGKRTLVRGAVLAPASIRVLRRIRAVGQSSEATPMRISVGSFGGFNADVGMDGILSQTVDVQVTTPALLVDGLELLVERGEHERLPILRHPLRPPQPAAPEEPPPRP